MEVPDENINQKELTAWLKTFNKLKLSCKEMMDIDGLEDEHTFKKLKDQKCYGTLVLKT